MINGFSFHLEFISLPVSQNAFVNSTVTFTCTAAREMIPNVTVAAFIISWRRNGDLLMPNVTMPLREVVNETVIRSTITFVAEERFNNTWYTCTAIAAFISGLHHEFESMPPGYLRLQGNLINV